MVTDGTRYCGVDDLAGAVEAGASVCRWGKKDITWTIVGQIPGFTFEQFKTACTEAWAYWSAVCDIRPKYVEEPVDANVLMGTGKIDGSSGTLAWSEMPCGNVRQLTQKYDKDERWVISANPTNGTDIVRVAAHEIGHVIGIPHISDGNLLAPYYSSKVRKPQAGDIREAVARYGQPAAPTPVPDPVPTPSPTGGIDWSALIKKLLEALLRALSK